MFTFINEVSYSVGKAEKINEHNTPANTDIVAQFTKQEQKEKTESQCNSAHKKQGRTMPEVSIYLNYWKVIIFKGTK